MTVKLVETLEPIDLETEAPEMPHADGTARKRFGVRLLTESLQGLWNECNAPQRQHGLRTGHFELDKLIGGYRPGHVTIIGAATSWGKTTFLLMAFDENDRVGKKTLLVSGEDPESLYVERLAARRTGINATKLRDKELAEHEKTKLFTVVAEARQTPWFLNGIGKPAEQLAQQVTDLCREEKYDLIIVDYIQAFSAKAQDRRNEVSTVARLFCDAIKAGGAAGLMASQLKRPDSEREMTMHDLKESGDLEIFAEHVIIGSMFKGTDSRDGEPEQKRYLKLWKNKDGPKGQEQIWLPFDRDTASFRRTST